MFKNCALGILSELGGLFAPTPIPPVNIFTQKTPTELVSQRKPTPRIEGFSNSKLMSPVPHSIIPTNSEPNTFEKQKQQEPETERWHTVQQIIHGILQKKGSIPPVLSAIILGYLEHDEAEHIQPWKLVAKWNPRKVAPSNIIISDDKLYTVVHDQLNVYNINAQNVIYDINNQNPIHSYSLKDLICDDRYKLFVMKDNTQQLYIIQQIAQSTRQQGSVINQLRAYRMEHDTFTPWKCFLENQNKHTTTKTIKEFFLSPYTSLIAMIEERRRTVTVTDIKTKESWRFEPAMPAYSVALSPNGNLLAMGVTGPRSSEVDKLLDIWTHPYVSTTNAVEIWSRKEQKRIIAANFVAQQLAVSNSQILSAAGSRVWQIYHIPMKYSEDEGQMLCPFTGHDNVHSVYISPNAEIFVALGNEADRNIEIRHIFDMGEIAEYSKYISQFSKKSSENLDVYTNNPEQPHYVVPIDTSTLATTLCFDRKTRYLAIGYNKGTIRLFKSTQKRDKPQLPTL